MAARRTRGGKVTFATVRRLARALPGAEEGTSYGTPAFRVRGSLFARLREDGDSLVLKVDPDVRDALVRSRPRIFYVTDHYRGYPMVLVRLSEVGLEDLRELLTESWRRAVPPRRSRAGGTRG